MIKIQLFKPALVFTLTISAREYYVAKTYLELIKNKIELKK
ncbi:hypothetical protein ES708_29083 [subsurface metagenome]